jgi:hypothetical protein
LAAFLAQQALNNFYLNKYNATLSVKWMIIKEPIDPPDSPVKSALDDYAQEGMIGQAPYLGGGSLIGGYS